VDDRDKPGHDDDRTAIDLRASLSGRAGDAARTLTAASEADASWFLLTVAATHRNTIDPP
jgi:hypothetical protein